MVPVGEIRHRIVQPFYLMLRRRLQHAALDDLLEHLISRLLEGRTHARFAPAIPILGHSPCTV
jgi:hypothetical protein